MVDLQQSEILKFNNLLSEAIIIIQKQNKFRAAPTVLMYGLIKSFN
jgi:hypothetical protein